MTPELSPAAKRELDLLERATMAADNWVSAYLEMLNSLAERDTATLCEWEVHGQGFEALERSRLKYRVALELKSYALTQIPVDISSQLSTLPDWVSLDDFLASLMPRTGATVRLDRFSSFMRHDTAQALRDRRIRPLDGLSNDDAIQSITDCRLASLTDDGVPQFLNYHFREEFASWWKSQASETNFAQQNQTRRDDADGRRTALAKLLPSSRMTSGITKEAWRGLAAAGGLVKSAKTFDRDVARLLEIRAVHKQGNGSFRKVAEVV